ncbi:hypothetical protein [Nostoc sp. ATCC 53789]|uniref:hypothetical protein n=1 Tax=Nostoc sp. ATCC 53789 TaxID=76335 RepID=UPI000DEC4593|nr:hypothetical protein [Nostoc sp. ATCC 53789]QHG21243.1 hypothetical protein GJB62_35950 [Nostoc sp. ATCC 53789]RCJ16633.1 hypothetical protein A6V25_30535 [Nostoc sp. ATCC 53789]
MNNSNKNTDSLKKFLLQTISLIIGSGVIGAIIGYQLNLYNTQHSNRIRDLYYKINKVDLINYDEPIKGSEIEVILNKDIKNPLQKIGVLTFSLYNLSDKDFDKVIIQLDISSKINKDFKIISAEIGTDPSQEYLIKNDKILSSTSQNLKTYKYEIKNINRSNIDKSENIYSTFKISYILADVKVDDIRIIPKIFGTGLNQFPIEGNEDLFNNYRAYIKYSNGDMFGFWLQKYETIIFGIGFILLQGLLQMFIRLIGAFINRKEFKTMNNNLREKLTDKLSEKENFDKLKDPKITEEEVKTLYVEVFSDTANDDIKKQLQEDNTEFSKTLEKAFSSDRHVNKINTMEPSRIANYLVKINHKNEWEKQTRFFKWFPWLSTIPKPDDV